MNATLTSRARAALLLAAFATLAVAACAKDDISGPTEQIGPPLLDIEIQPAGAPAFPTGTFTLNTRRDTMTITLRNLPPLPAGSSYQVLLVDSATSGTAGANNAIPATGRLIRSDSSTRPVTRDSSVAIVRRDTAAATSVVDTGGTLRAFTLRITNASINDDIAKYSHVVVVVTTSPATAATRIDAATKRGFLWARYRNTGVTPVAFATTGTFTFGTFAINSAGRLAYTIQGTAIGAFYGDQFRANFSKLIRPPEGFQYVAWLIDERTGKQLRLGGLETPVPERRSLVNSDVEQGSSLTDVAIFAAQLRAPVDTADNYTRFVLLLEPKGGSVAVAGGAEAFAAAIPVSVSSRHPAAGKLFGTVQSTSSKPVANTTLYLTGVGFTNPLQVAVADATGAFRFRTVNTGAYILNVIPPGDNTVRSKIPVTIAARRKSANEVVGDSIFVMVTIP
ncbi:MAG: carboxypeptidase-like regulatory domain-containing protein [Gemmatimonadaceae bacterium]